MTARETAALALFDIAEKEAWSDAALRRHLEKANLSTKDSALATQLVYGVIQNRMLCDWYLRHFSTIRLAKIVPRVLICLELSAYQILMLDRIPSHAAVDETVAIVRKYGRVGERAVSFTNAVLRALSAAAESNSLPRLNCPDKESYYSLKYSHPEWLVRRLSDQYGQKQTEQILQANNALAPTSVRINQHRVKRESVLNHFIESGFHAEVHPTAPAIILVSGGDITSDPLFRAGDITIQDAAAAAAVEILAPQPDTRVIDCCAAPGGKSFYMAECMENRGSLTSCDVYAHKLQKIAEHASRVGAVCLQTCLQDARDFRSEWEQTADFVLCDVPCSGMGIIRKKPEIRYKPEEPLRSLPEIQLAILENCSRYLKQDGILVYSTCTIFKEENEGVISHFLKKHPDFEAVSFRHPLCGKCESGMLTLLPHLHNTDGFFIAKLRRKV